MIHPLEFFITEIRSDKKIGENEIFKNDPEKSEAEKERRKYRRKLNILKELVENLKDSDDEDLFVSIKSFLKRCEKLMQIVNEIKTVLEDEKTSNNRS